MRVALVGFDTEGKSSYAFFTKLNADIVIHDQNPDCAVPSGAQAVLGETYLDGLDDYDLVVRTAGMQPSIITDKYPGLADTLTTHVELFMRHCPTTNIIGVTGTKGKGTTSTLITKLLEASGRRVFLGGNIGVPPLDFVDLIGPDDWVVLELSSFQLMNLQHSPHIAVCLMVVPEHLNWHADMDEYIWAKSQLFAHQGSDDVAIYAAFSEPSRVIASAGDGHKLPFYTQEQDCAYVANNALCINGKTVCPTDKLGLLGAHNWQNACAAVTAVWQAGVTDLTTISSVLQTFNGLEHRLARVATVSGVTYYDDSFGTTPETAIVALQAFQSPKIIILGGSDKGASYDELASAVIDNNVRTVLLIGDQATAIRKALENQGYTNCEDGGTTMRDIVAKAASCAKAGDVVLLSTACASFDMFTDYKDRGNQFIEAVQALAAPVQ